MARLFLSFLGTFHAALDHRPLTGFESGKVRALLVYLVAQRERQHTRDALAGLLWPDFPNEVARKNLRQALNNLRRTLGDPEASPPFLHISRDIIQWNSESDFWLDTAEFRHLLAACADHTHRHPARCRSCAQRRQQAVTLYRGEFLAHFFLADSQPFEEWLLLQRESLHRLIMPALYQLAAFYEESGQPEQVQHYAARQLELNPWHEEAHRQMMHALAVSGQRSAALAQYHTCCRLLEKELGARPTKITRELYAQIQVADEDTMAYVRVPVHTLPRPLTPLVGRQQELSQLANWLDEADCRLLMLTGPGGVGKTRLALQTAQEMAATFRDGVTFMNLGPIASSEFLIAAIAQALLLPLSEQLAPAVQVRHFLAGKEILLVLDEFEQLVADIHSCSYLAELLAHAPALTLLVTSRERLGISGEWVLEVNGLPVVAEEMAITTGADTAVADAVTLFVQQARQIQANFELTAANRPAIRRICHLVEGMPLALELAAAWVQHLTCEEIALEIEQGLLLMSGQRREGEQASIHAVFDRSWRQLSPEEQQLLAALSVFRGGFDRDAARQVTSASLPLLAGLANKSLLRRELDGRYRMHSLLRQYADEQLQAMMGKEEVCKQHLRYFVKLAQEGELALHGREQHFWLHQLEVEQSNLQAALSWGTIHEREEAARLVSALALFWFMGGHLYEGRRYFEHLYAYRHQWPHHLQAQFLIGCATMYGGQGDMSSAELFTKEALHLFQELNDDEGIATALQYLGIVAHYADDMAKAMSLREQALSFARRLPDQWLTRHILNNMIDGYVDMREFERGEALATQALAMSREAGDVFSESYLLLILAAMARERGDNKRSRQLLNQALSMAEGLHNRYVIADALKTLGEICLAEDALPQARQYLKQAVRLFEELGDMGRTASVRLLLTDVL